MQYNDNNMIVCRFLQWLRIDYINIKLHIQWFGSHSWLPHYLRIPTTHNEICACLMTWRDSWLHRSLRTRDGVHLHRFRQANVHHKPNLSNRGQQYCITSRTIQTFTFWGKGNLEGCLQRWVRGPRKLSTPLDPIWNFFSQSWCNNKKAIIWWNCTSIRNGQYAECERQLRGPLRGHRGVGHDNMRFGTPFQTCDLINWVRGVDKYEVWNSIPNLWSHKLSERC